MNRASIQDVIKAVATEAVDANEEPIRPVKAWFLGGKSVLDFLVWKAFN